MDDGHVRDAEGVMAYLAQKARSEWTMRQHRECLAGLAERLRERGLGYSEDAAWEWPEGIAGGLDKTRRSSYVGALAKLGDTCATGETGSFHHGAPKKEDRPCGRHKRLVDDYRACLRGSGLAPATVGNHRAAATRFLLDPRDRGAGSVADASCADLTRILLACEDMTYRAKTCHRGMMRSLLAYLHSIGLVRHGFTLMVDAVVPRKGYCRDRVDPEIVADLRVSQADGAGGIALEAYLDLVDALAAGRREHGYSQTAIRAVSHFGNLPRPPAGADVPPCDPQVGRVWPGSTGAPPSGGDLPGCRRAVMPSGQGHEGVTHDLGRAVVPRKTLLDRLPGRRASQVGAFLATRGAEGREGSTLDMLGACVCRLCMLVDGIGVADFADVTAEHARLLDARDPHATPEGKNASDSRMRQLPGWPGGEGGPSGPHPLLALPNTAAPRETAVVTPAPDEQHEPGRVLADGGGVSLRDKAMPRLGLRMGVRASDVVALPGGGISWDGATVRFARAKTGYEAGPPMPADVANAACRHVVAGRPESREESVFPRREAPPAPLDAGAARRSLRKALPDRGIPGSGSRSLRKTFASNMPRGGATPAQVAEALGHRGIGNVRKRPSLDEERMRPRTTGPEGGGPLPEGGFGDGRQARDARRAGAPRRWPACREGGHGAPPPHGGADTLEIRRLLPRARARGARDLQGLPLRTARARPDGGRPRPRQTHGRGRAAHDPRGVDGPTRAHARRAAKGGARSSHVMTGDERSAFFAQVDAYRPAGGCAAYRRLAGEYKVPSRAACRRGPRDSEACGVPGDRAGPDAGASAMARSRGRRDGVVHVADDLTAPCPGCLAWPRGLPGPRPGRLLPSKDPGKPLADTSVDRVFGRLRDATAFAPECSDKPVVHDLRFGFITDRADRWALDGVDVEAMMPYLSRYVGHKDLQSTYHYIHTSEQLRDVIAKYDVTGSSAIPEVDYGQR